MFQTRLKTALKLFFLALALATSFLIGPTHSMAASPDFSLSANPTSQTIERGQDALYTISVTALNGFAGTVTLTVSGVPNHDVGSFNPTSVTGAGNSQLDLHANRTESPLGTFTLTVTGTSGSLQHTVQVTVTIIPVPDFSLTANTFTQTVKPGTTAVYIIKVSSVPGTNFTGTVNLSVAGLPANTTASFTPTSVVVPGTSELDIHTNSQTPIGNFAPTVTGVSGSLSHFLDLTFEVIPPTSDFSLSASPTSQTAQRGGLNAVYVITVTPKNGFNGTVNFTVTGVPANDLGFFNPTSVTTSGSVDFLFNAGTTSSLGTFTLTITGTSGPLQHSIQVTCQVTS